ncbi:hypothetical protein SADUNF_Sadunf09G0067100 [Salix dunnii]|uniref:SCP domain-containing protein n=1 Tax=Salix dunnii TaxID=1413687 RepID=A0A835JQX9_9ROSI|nr:hypothetical protein SADUNF_Sadunf09G0067100 [Salix dunnii]
MWFGKFLFAAYLIVSVSDTITSAQNSPQDYVDAHNAVRAEVGVGPIAWNKTVAAYAQKYANSRVQSCEMEHSGGPYGENIAEGYGNLNGVDAVKMWASEKPFYSHDTNSCVDDECLHYTQIVWRKSVHLGCGRAKCRNGWCGFDYDITRRMGILLTLCRNEVYEVISGDLHSMCNSFGSCLTCPAEAKERAVPSISTCNVIQDLSGESAALASYPLAAAEAVELWASEKPYYDYDTNAHVNRNCVHYTQIDPHRLRLCSSACTMIYAKQHMQFLQANNAEL